MTKKLSKLQISLISVIGVLVLTAVDQLIKYFVCQSLKPIGSITVIPKVLAFTYVENDGAMLGMMGGKTTLMTVLAIICAVLILAVLFSGKLGYSVEYVCTLLMLAGGTGNIIDRIARNFVVDYIEVLFVDFYVFNFADCLITCSAIVIIIYEIYLTFKSSADKKKALQEGSNNG